MRRAITSGQAVTTVEYVGRRYEKRTRTGTSDKLIPHIRAAGTASAGWATGRHRRGPAHDPARDP